ncbi:MAG: hypothetical protein JNK37_15475 [Verrucomicrobiales bacterium]|nr:hypothetical protein [Verrucomicrobiales bacterium]
METERKRTRNLVIAAALAVALITVGVVFAFVHDGKSYAIEAALPQLDLEENAFILREAWWNGELKPGETKIFQHQLFKRNEYWFWLGSSIPESKVNLHVYDSDGRLADAEAWNKDNVAGVRVVPENSGTFYIRVAIDEAAETPVEWAVIYAYR